MSLAQLYSLERAKKAAAPAKPPAQPAGSSESQMGDAFMAEFERRVLAQKDGSSPLRS